MYFSEGNLATFVGSHCFFSQRGRLPAYFFVIEDVVPRRLDEARICFGAFDRWRAFTRVIEGFTRGLYNIQGGPVARVKGDVEIGRPNLTRDL